MIKYLFIFALSFSLSSCGFNTANIDSGKRHTALVFDSDLPRTNGTIIIFQTSKYDAERTANSIADKYGFEFRDLEVGEIVGRPHGIPIEPGADTYINHQERYRRAARMIANFLTDEQIELLSYDPKVFEIYANYVLVHDLQF